MKIFPAIDLYEGKAVRLFKGEYDKLTVYSDTPLSVARDFLDEGCECMHIVDLEGAKDGTTPNLELIKELVKESGLFCEVGGGIRSLEVVKRYIDAGVGRVILGTAAVTDREFLKQALALYGEKIAVGVDLKDGYVAIKGWTQKSSLEGFAFMKELEELGVKTVILTDISKDGAMAGANHALYAAVNERLSLNVIASGGVSSIEDVKRLRDIGTYGAIVGKAYYVGAIKLAEACEVAK